MIPRSELSAAPASSSRPLRKRKQCGSQQGIDSSGDLEIDNIGIDAADCAFKMPISDSILQKAASSSATSAIANMKIPDRKSTHKQSILAQNAKFVARKESSAYQLRLAGMSKYLQIFALVLIPLI